MSFRGAPGNFDSGTTVQAFWLRFRAGSVPVQVGEGAPADDGSADIEVTIPSDTPPGVYLAYLQGTASGLPRVLVAPLVVRPVGVPGALQAASNRARPIAGDPSAASSGERARSSAVPPALSGASADELGESGSDVSATRDVAAPAGLQPLSPLAAAEEEAAVEAAMQGARPVLLPDGRIEMRGVGLSGSAGAVPSSRPPAPPLVIAAVFAAWGVLRLRRRALAGHRR